MVKTPDAILKRNTEYRLRNKFRYKCYNCHYYIHSKSNYKRHYISNKHTKNTKIKVSKLFDNLNI